MDRGRRRLLCSEYGVLDSGATTLYVSQEVATWLEGNKEFGVDVYTVLANKAMERECVLPEPTVGQQIFLLRIHRIPSILRRLQKARYVSSIDIKNGYWQVLIRTQDQQFTAFVVPGKGLFQ